MTFQQNSIPAHHNYLPENPMLAAMFESNLLAVAAIDDKGCFTSINEGFCELFGVNRVDLINHSVCKIFSSLSIEQYAFLLGGAPPDKGVANKSFLLSHKRNDGSLCRIKITYDRIPVGGMEACFLLAVDVTDEMSLAESNSAGNTLQNALINNTQDLIWSVDTSFNLMAANDAFVKAMERRYGIHCKKGDQLLCPQRYSPEILELWRTSYQSVLDGKEYRREVFVPGLAGNGDSWLEVSFNPIYEQETDGIIGIACSSRDITERKLAENRLTESELRLAESQEVAKMGNWETDLINLSVVWSDETYRIFDMEPRSRRVLHQDFLAFVHPDDTQKVSDAFTVSLSSENVEIIEHRIITATGQLKEVEQRWRIYRDPAGVALRALGTCHDITIRKQAERNLQESDLLYRSVIEQATDSICIADANLNFIDINPSGCAAFGYTKEEMLGLNVKDVLFEEDLVDNPLQGADLKAGKTITNERRIKRKDGSAVLVELTGKALADGKIMYCGRDITERKANEQYLKESNERYDLISRATNDMVWDWDLVTGKVYRNREGWKKIFRSDPKQDSDGDIMDWNERIHPEDIDTVTFVSGQTLISDREFFAVECRVRRDDGSYAFVHDKGHIIRDEQGKALRVIGATQDITDRKEAALEVEKSEARFRLLIQNSSDLVSILDDRGYYTYCSLAITKMLGYEPEFMVGKNAFAFIHPEDVETIKEQFRTTKCRELFEIIPFRYINKNGEWRWLESRVTDMSNNPDIGGFVFNSRDVTDRVVAAQEIKKLSLIAQETSNAVIITNPAGELVWVNDAFTRMTEYKLYEVLGKKPGQFLQGPLTNAATVRYMHRKMEQRLPFECDIINYTKSGSTYWLRLQCQPQFDKNGQVESYFSMQTDISQEKETESILKRSEEQYRYLFHNNPASILIWDLETLEILEVNETAESLYGYGRKEFIGKRVLDLRRENEQEKIKVFAKQARQHANFKAVKTWKHLNKKGDEMYINISSHRIDYNGRSVILAMGNNVTDKLELEKILEQERQARQKEITEAVLSAQEQERHELGRELHDNINQILASSLLYLGLAKSNFVSDHPFIDKADQLIQSAINEVRNLSHSLIPPSLNDSELLEALSKVLDITRVSGGLHIDLESTGFDEKKVPDNLKLTVFRMVQEQLNNILKHASATHVQVSLTLQNDQLQLAIKDNGIGFNTSKKSAGVGLMNIRTRAALFNGKLCIESSPGAGCSLSVFFTVAPMDN